MVYCRISVSTSFNTACWVKISADDILNFFLIFPGVSEKYEKYHRLSSAEFAPSMVSVKSYQESRW